MSRFLIGLGIVSGAIYLGLHMLAYTIGLMAQAIKSW